MLKGFTDNDDITEPGVEVIDGLDATTLFIKLINYLKLQTDRQK